MKYKVIDQIPDDLYREVENWTDHTIYHTKAWHQVLETTFGWKVKALLAYDNNEMVAYLPFIRKRRLLKKSNVALPLSHHVGFAMYSDTVRLNEPTDINIEIHAPAKWDNASQRSSYVVTTLQLSDYSSTDSLFESLHKSSIQRKIKKAMKCEFEIQTAPTATCLTDFTHLQALTRHRQGSPTYPSAFFHHMADALTDNFQVSMAYYDGKAIAGIIFLYDKDRAIYGYGASLPDTDLLRLGVNQLVMWEAIKTAFGKGLSIIDFGITPMGHESLRQYKEKWAAKSEPLPYTYVGDSDNIKRESSSVQLVSNILQHTPYMLFRLFSPLLLREVI